MAVSVASSSICRSSTRFASPTNTGWRGVNVRFMRPSLSLLSELRPELRQSRERGIRQRTLGNRGGGVFEVLEARIAEQHGGDRGAGERKAQRGLDEAGRVAFLHERLEQPRAAHVEGVFRRRRD